MEFLPGNHTLNQTISVTNLTSLTLLGDSSSLLEITSRIVCTWPAGFVFTGITELHINSLAFISCGHSDSAAVNIISVHQSNISNCSFYNSTNTDQSDKNDGGALHIQNSDVLLTGNIFQNNTADVGGVIYVVGGNLTVTDNKFQNNSAVTGAALNAEDSTLTVIDNTFQNNSAELGGVLSVGGSNLTVTDNTFQNNSADAYGGVLEAENSDVTVTGNTFQGNSAAHTYGGVMQVVHGNLTAADNTFQNNTAGDDGGVLSSYDSNLIVTDNTFQNNNAADCGGVLSVENSILTVTNNTFQHNSATSYGGALHAEGSTVMVTYNIFETNSAEAGGVLHTGDSNLSITNNTFQNNSATNHGGVLHVEYSNLTITGNTFQNSAAGYGGVLHTTCSTLSIVGNAFKENVGTALGGAIFVDGQCLFQHQSIVRMYGNNLIENNRAEYGGGIAALDISQLELEGNVIKKCTASYGGGLYVHNTVFTGNVTLTNNSATEGGGGMFASSSTIHFAGNSSIMNNSGKRGGGLLLSGGSQFYLQPETHVYFIGNSAEHTGGAIKVEDSNPLVYCIHSEFNLSTTSDCFFQVNTLEKYEYITPSSIKQVIDKLRVGIYFGNNSAEAGADLYGGSVDNCKSNIKTISCHGCFSGDVFTDIIMSENTPDISSDPLYICTCGQQTDCTGVYHSQPVYPGGTLEVPVIARGQRNGTTAAAIQIISTLNSNVTIQENESVQNANNSCTVMKYTTQSFEENTIQSMTLYAQGPCLPTDSNTLKIHVNILHCPPGFQLSNTQPICICTERLQQFTNSCLVDNRTIHRTQHAQFWVGYDNKSDGVILRSHCPFDYCTSEETYLAVDDSDKQCNYNRSGLLCGRCSDNLSLALGSSRCLQCSNSYLSLLAAFALAGIALVVFLLVLRLTVAAGTINGLIFYANVVAVNSAIFFQPQNTNVPTVNILTVFIAWLNLDLGIETCFYNGMDAYGKIWLQFAFPLYVWALVGMIIIGSHYSRKVAQIFGSNPIAVLATLFLLSYAKLLRTVIAALSYTFLEYPNKHIAMWLYDGNIRYLSGKHIPLFIAALICLIFLFLPFMLLLIFSQWLQAEWKFQILSWINSPKVKPFLDAYHAPYTDKHRYSTGLMLLLRFILFLIFAVNALGDPTVNLLTIASTTAAILTFTTLSSRIYKTWSLGLLETSFILNLTILAVASLYIRPSGGNQNAVTFTSVGIAFATFIGIVIYHSIQQIKGTRLWRRVWPKHDDMRVPLTDVDSGPAAPPDLVLTSGTAPTQTVVDVHNSELREPCMATDQS